MERRLDTLVWCGVCLLLGLLFLLASADAGELQLVAGHAPHAVEVLAGHLLQLQNQQRHSCTRNEGGRIKQVRTCAIPIDEKRGGGGGVKLRHNFELIKRELCAKGGRFEALARHLLRFQARSGTRGVKQT